MKLTATISWATGVQFWIVGGTSHEQIEAYTKDRAAIVGGTVTALNETTDDDDEALAKEQRTPPVARSYLMWQSVSVPEDYQF